MCIFNTRIKLKVQILVTENIMLTSRSKIIQEHDPQERHRFTEQFGKMVRLDNRQTQQRDQDLFYLITPTQQFPQLTEASETYPYTQLPQNSLPTSEEAAIFDVLNGNKQPSEVRGNHLQQPPANLINQWQNFSSAASIDDSQQAPGAGLEDQYSDPASESEESEFALAKQTIRKLRRSRKRDLNKTDLNRNNFPNITRNAVKLISEICEARPKSLLRIKQYAKRILKEKTCSRARFMTLINSQEQQEKVKRIFARSYEKMLRKRYMVNALKNGRMEKSKLSNYIRTKNQECLYILDQSCKQNRT